MRRPTYPPSKGFRMASGDLVGWINTDDAYAPEALAAVACRTLARGVFGRAGIFR